MALFNRAADSTSAANAQPTFTAYDSADGPRCPLPNNVEALTLHGSIYNSLLYTAYACMAFVCVSQLAQIAVHLYHYRCPAEQRQVIRILFAPIVLAIISWAQIYSYTNANYIDPIGSFYESIALCSLYLLVVEYTGDTVNMATRARRSWLLVFQFPITELVAIIVLEATSAQGIFCRESLQPQYGHLWYQLLSSVGVALCITSILGYFKANKASIKARKPLGKLFCFKGIVFLSFIQSWIISGLLQDGHLIESDQWSYGDFLYGLPNFIFLLELVIFSILFWFAYPIKDYIGDEKPLVWYWALLDVLDFRDFGHGFKMALIVARMGRAAKRDSLEEGVVVSASKL